MLPAGDLPPPGTLKTCRTARLTFGSLSMTLLRLRLPILFLCLLCIAAPCPAQTPLPRDELLRLVPKDFGLCLIVNDLRGQTEKWQASNWFKSLSSSALGRSLLAAPEVQDLLKF